ncbi:MAG: APC family permease [Acidobacteriota bacterium]|jgi:APA family basic amino acid/polyamine antiporter
MRRNSGALGMTSAVALVTANMIGAGVFTTSGFALADLGSRREVLLAWCLGGLIALAGALSYGGLVRHITESGGEYLFLGRVVHPGVGFMAGWVSLLAGFTGAIAFAATAFEAYAVPEGSRPPWLPPGAVAIALILACGGLHGRIVRHGLIAQNLVVGVKLLLLAAFIGYAGWRLEDPGWAGLRLPDPGAAFSLPALASSLVWISLSYSGFNAAVYVAGEVREAERTVPRALWAGTLGVTAIYLLLNAIFLFGAPPEAVSGRPDVAAVAAEALGGPALGRLIRVVIGLALASSVSSMILAGPRVYARMAQDGTFPPWFRMPAGSGEAPAAAVTLQVALAVVVSAVSTLGELLSYLGFTLSLSAAGTVACLFLLHRRGVAAPCPGYPWVPALYVGSTLLLAALAASHRPRELLASVLTLGSGAVAYRILRRPTAGAP